MKKLMIAAAIVCAAAMTQAASFVWTTDAKQYAPNIDLGNLKEGHVGNSGSTYLAAMTAVTWSFTMDLDNGTLEDSIKNHGLDYQMNKVKVTGLSSDVVFKPGEGLPDNKVAYNIVITGTYTDGNGDVWTIKSDAIVDTASFSSITGDPITIGSKVASGWTVTTSAVPEPTSGLLLLLGVAGLALRRRRA